MRFGRKRRFDFGAHPRLRAFGAFDALLQSFHALLDPRGDVVALVQRFLVAVDHAGKRALQHFDSLDQLERGASGRRLGGLHAAAHALGERTEIVGGNRHQQFLLVVEVTGQRAHWKTRFVADAVECHPARTVTRDDAPGRGNGHAPRLSDIHQARRARFIKLVVNSRTLVHRRPSRVPLRPEKDRWLALSGVRRDA